jgi:hypothetical protein
MTAKFQHAEMPPRIRALPLDPRGYPVPWFVCWIDGKPDFRVIDSAKFRAALRFRRCWICGEPLGSHFAFVIGPMCAINRISSEPPSHVDCAIFAAKACPFLTLPKAKRRTANLPSEGRAPPGNHLERNPGVALIWKTRNFSPFRAPDGGILIRIGDPNETIWFAEGRAAMRDECLASIDGGYPFLEEEAASEGPDALRTLAEMRDRALALLPAE